MRNKKKPVLDPCTIGSDSEIVVMTGYASVDSAVACMRAGAFDYLEKPGLDQRRIVQTLGRALEYRSLRVRNRELEVALERRSTLEAIVAQSAPSPTNCWCG